MQINSIRENYLMKKIIVLFYLVISIVLLNYWFFFYDRSSTSFPFQNNTVLYKTFTGFANVLSPDNKDTVEKLSPFRAKNYILKRRDLVSLSDTNCTLASHFFQQKKYKLSLLFYQKALDQKKTLNDQKGMAHIYARLSELYARKFAVSSGNAKEMQVAMIYGLQASQIAEKLKEPYLIADANKNVVLAYEKLKSTGNTFRVFEINNSTNDSVLYYSENEALEFAHVLWINEKKQQQIDSLSKLNRNVLSQKIAEVNQYKNLVLSLIFLLELATVSVLFYWMYTYKRKEITRQKELSRMSLLRLQNIRNRISPHFIFNILNREISSEENKERCQEMIGLVEFLRRSIEITEKISVTLEEELDFVKNYLDIEQKSLDHDFLVNWDIGPGMDLRKMKIPAMIMQIPVENALKHALRPKQGDKQLTIAIRQETRATKITIQDNGDGYHPELLLETKGTGTGLKVLYQTIMVLNQRNVEHIVFTITDVKDKMMTGTKVEINVPFIYNYEI